jgi:hypothetical protein
VVAGEEPKNGEAAVTVSRLHEHTVNIVPMKASEIPIVAGPRSEYMEVLLSALNEDDIPARIVLIADVEPLNRPEWACTPGDEVYVVVPRDKREVALELTRWVSRVCKECETVLMPRVSSCQKCGAAHSLEPGPHFLDGLKYF